MLSITSSLLKKKLVIDNIEIIINELLIDKNSYDFITELNDEYRKVLHLVSRIGSSKTGITDDLTDGLSFIN